MATDGPDPQQTELGAAQRFACGNFRSVHAGAAARNQFTAPESDPHEQAKLSFEKLVAGELNEAVRTGRVNSIVLAAPAHALRNIRWHLNKATAAVVSRTLAKDLTNVPHHELSGHFD